MLLFSHSVMFNFWDPWTATCQACFTISWSMLKLMSIVSVMPSSHLIHWCPLLLLFSIRVFSKELALCIRWPEYWSFSISISSYKYSGLISLKIDWFDLLTILDSDLAQIHVHRVNDAINRLILCHPLLLPPSIFPSIRVFSSESVLHIR